MRQILTLFLMFIVAAFSYGQTPTPTPNSTPRPTVARNPYPIKILKFVRQKKLGFLPSFADDYGYFISYYEKPDSVLMGGRIILYRNLWKATIDGIDSIVFSFLIGNQGKKLIKPSQIKFDIYASTRVDGCLYENNHALSFIIDDKPPELVEKLVSKSVAVYGKGCVQRFEVAMKYELFAKLASSKKVMVIFGPKTINLKEGNHLKIIRGVHSAFGVY